MPGEKYLMSQFNVKIFDLYCMFISQLLAISGNNGGGNGLSTKVWDLLWTLCHIAIGNRQPPSGSGAHRTQWQHGKVSGNSIVWCSIVCDGRDTY